MDGLGGHYSKWNKLEKGILYIIPYMCNLKIQQASDYNNIKQKQTHRIENKLVATSGEKEMATHSSILVWRTPWTEEPGRLRSTGLQESDTT